MILLIPFQLRIFHVILCNASAASTFSIPWILKTNVIKPRSHYGLVTWNLPFVLKIPVITTAWASVIHSILSHGTGNPTLYYIKDIYINEPTSWFLQKN